jgi:NADPH2:quinone reductase
MPSALNSDERYPYVEPMKAIYVETPGGPENLIYGDIAKPSPGQGQALVKLAAAGVNFIDIYFRTGLYRADSPIVLGMEGAGIVEAVGDGVTEVKPGDRVAYAMTRGSDAEYASVPAWQLVKIPDSVDFVSAAAVMLQGMTAHYLAFSTFPLKRGDTCLVHAAAGGVGLLLTQIAKKIGATVIATAGNPEKLELARGAGADHGIDYTKQDFEQEVKRITGGRGADVVYDGVGAATFLKGLDSLRPRGMMVSFGNASGPVPPIQPLILSQKGSLFLTRPTLMNYATTRDEVESRAADLFRWLEDGSLKLRVAHRYPLADAAQAQRDLEARKTTGKLVLEIQ